MSVYDAFLHYSSERHETFVVGFRHHKKEFQNYYKQNHTKNVIRHTKTEDSQ